MWDIRHVFLYFPHLSQHLPVLLTSAAACFIASLVLHVWILWNPPIPTKKKSPDRARAELVSQMISCLHAIYVSWGAIDVLRYSRNLYSDRIWGLNQNAIYYISVSLGYWLYDFFPALYETRSWKDGIFIVHHIVAFLLFFPVYRPFCLFYAMLFILWEISTPFMNMRTILIAYGYGHTPFFKFVHYGFGLTFILIRNIGGPIASYFAISELYPYFIEYWTEDLVLMTYITGYIIAANVFLNLLNAFWLTQLVAGHNRSMKVANANHNDGSVEQVRNWKHD